LGKKRERKKEREKEKREKKRERKKTVALRLFIGPSNKRYRRELCGLLRN